MQTSLFENIQPIEVRQPALRQADVMRSAFVETHKWQEFHENGKLWIDGEIAVVPELPKGIYDYNNSSAIFDFTWNVRLLLFVISIIAFSISFLFIK